MEGFICRADDKSSHGSKMVIANGEYMRVLYSTKIVISELCWQSRFDMTCCSSSSPPEDFVLWPSQQQQKDHNLVQQKWKQPEGLGLGLGFEHNLYQFTTTDLTFLG